jgi:MFS family permease
MASHPSSLEHVQPGLSKKGVAAVVVGNAMEFYDFICYATFAKYIAGAYFPNDSEYVSLMLSVMTFALGFVTRPIGGFVIGAIGDRVGRKPAMLLTVGMIALGTLGIAATPTYASIGMAAPIIVVMCRLLQGLALGGEVGPSTACLIESAPERSRGLYSAWQLAGQGMALCLGGMVGVSLALLLSADQLASGGWRVPFYIGLLVLPVAIVIRRQLPETISSDERETSSSKLFSTIFVDYWKLTLLAILTIAAATTSTYIGNYMTTYAITTLHLPASIALGATIMVGAATIVGSLLGGWLSDRYGRKPIMIVPRIGTLLVIYPAFMYLVNNAALGSLLCVSGFLSLLTAVSGSAAITLIPELMPKAYRSTIIAVTYAIGVTIFGGITQPMVTWLIHVTANPLAPALYVMAISVLSLVAMLLLPESNPRRTVVALQPASA